MNTYSTLPVKKYQTEIVLTPLKGKVRRDSVEIIGEDKMTPMPKRRRISSTPNRSSIKTGSSMLQKVQNSKNQNRTKNSGKIELFRDGFERKRAASSPIKNSFVRKVPIRPEMTNQTASSLIGVTQRATVSRLTKEDINIEELEWTQFHIAIFENILVFFEGSDCRFESRIELGSIKSIKRIRIKKKVGLIVVLMNKPVSIILRFRNRNIRQQWYTQLTRKNTTNTNKQTNNTRASSRSDKSYNLTNLNISGSEPEQHDEQFDILDDDDVFELADDAQEVSVGPVDQPRGIPRSRTRSCPDNDSNLTKSIESNKPTFQSLRKMKKSGKINRIGSNSKVKKTLFDSIKLKAEKLKFKLLK